MKWFKPFFFSWKFGAVLGAVFLIGGSLSVDMNLQIIDVWGEIFGFSILFWGIAKMVYDDFFAPPSPQPEEGSCYSTSESPRAVSRFKIEEEIVESKSTIIRTNNGFKVVMVKRRIKMPTRYIG